MRKVELLDSLDEDRDGPYKGMKLHPKFYNMGLQAKDYYQRLMKQTQIYILDNLEAHALNATATRTQDNEGNLVPLQPSQKGSLSKLNSKLRGTQKSLRA